MKHLIITITLLISSIAYAQSNNVAAISWVLYDDWGAFRKTPELIERFLCNEKSKFKVCNNNLFEVDINAPIYVKNENSNTSFEGILIKALNVLSDKDSILIVAIASHGLEGIIGRQNLPFIYHREFIDLLFSKIDERQKTENIQIHLILFYDACHSNSILDYIKQSAQDSTGKYFDGSEKYKYKIDLYASSKKNKTSEGTKNIFWEVLLKATQSNEELLECNKEYCLTNKELENYFLKDNYNSHCLWSSYKDINSYITNYLLPNLGEVLEDKDNDKTIKIAAVMALREIGTPRAISYLKKALENNDILVGIKAANALHKLGYTSEVIPYLGEVLKNKDNYSNVKQNAIYALERIGTPEVIPYLGKVLEDKDNNHYVKGCTIDALKEIGTPEVIPYLKEALKDNNPSIKIAAANALHKLGYTSEVIPYLGEVLKNKDNYGNVKPNAIYALERIGTPEVIPYLGEVLEDKNNNHYVKWYAIDALKEIGTPEVIPYLGKALLEDNDPKVKKEAARALLIIVTPDTPEAIPYLGKALNDRSVKVLVADALDKIGVVLRN